MIKKIRLNIMSKLNSRETPLLLASEDQSFLETPKLCNSSELLSCLSDQERGIGRVQDIPSAVQLDLSYISTERKQ